MSRLSRWLLSSVVILAIAGLHQPTVSRTEAAAGRSFPRCMGASNEAERQCKDRCHPDCLLLFPGDDTAIGFCTGECNALCRSIKKDAKAICKANRDEPSPTEP